MNVLWLTDGLPYPADAGSRIRDFHLIREVARTSTVHLFSLVLPGEPTEPGQLREFCKSIEIFVLPGFLSRRQLGSFLRSILARRPLAAFPFCCAEAIHRLQAIMAREKIDVFQVEHSLLAAYIDATPRKGACRTVLSLHNVCFEQYRQMARLDVGLAARTLYRLKAIAMSKAERHYIPRFDCCVVVSAAEHELLQREVPEARTVVIENGVDCSQLRPLPESPGSGLLFVGVMGYPPNCDGLMFFARSILPRIRSSVPDAKLFVVGQAPPARVKALGRKTGIEVTGYVNDILPYYRLSKVTVVPLRAGGGTRLKILESMALGRAVVSTTIGCAGLEVRHGVHLLIADGPQQFADCVVQLLRNDALRAELVGNARRMVEERYDWANIGGQLALAHREIVAGAPPLGQRSAHL
jgi:sugar transferase (PEP-CTERM/EpsH1 system associated)